MSGTGVEELYILNGKGDGLFDKGDTYEIPLYQRPYAWGEEHIEQLIEDIKDISTNETYYLGSLVVFPKEEYLYEVIDGQQRLTTLYLLLSALGIDFPGDKGENNLRFSCREKSDYTLANLGKLDGSGELENKMVEQSIVDGMRIIKQKLASDFTDEDIASLKENLKRTCLYRIEVPEHTDLNHYFEIMNTRGEQLEQHEVVKAWLMEPLQDQESLMFARIWDACSDMSQYVQKSFNTSEREALFGVDYDAFPKKEAIESFRWKDEGDDEALGLKALVSSDSLNKGGGSQGEEEDDDPSSFESIISFSYFLLHALNVFVETRRIKALPEEISLDDRRLDSTFRSVIQKGEWDEYPISEDKKKCSKEFSKEFIECLLQTRFLFDKYVIKRKHKEPGDDGNWSLQELSRGNSQTDSGTRRTSSYPKDTVFEQKETHESTLMIQSCLRVSYTSPRSMRWITDLLTWLTENPSLVSSGIVSKLEDFAKKPVKEFLDKKDYMQGVGTPHIVLNFLDYLLWKGDKSTYKDFVFEFRNSVEHWYPQNPLGDLAAWDKRDRFGNLCLVQRNDNSKFSNLSPCSKKESYNKRIDKGSLKLRIMAALTQNNEDWRDGVCKKHEDDMIRLLEESCGILPMQETFE